MRRCPRTRGSRRPSSSDERHRPTPLPATGRDCSPRHTRYGLAARPTAAANDRLCVESYLLLCFLSTTLTNLSRNRNSRKPRTKNKHKKRLPNVLHNTIEKTPFRIQKPKIRNRVKSGFGETLLTNHAHPDVKRPILIVGQWIGLGHGSPVHMGGEQVSASSRTIGVNVGKVCFENA